MAEKIARITQRFNPDSLEHTRQMTPTQIADFISDYQQVFFSNEGDKKLISMRVPEKLLNSFKAKAKLSNRSYQNIIVDLMRDWLTRHI